MNRKLLLALVAFAVSLQAQPQFEVVSIRASEPITAQGTTAGVHIDGAQVRCVLLSLRDYLRIAYKVKDYQIQGPDWMASARFDIVAKLPAGATAEQVPEMVGCASRPAIPDEDSSRLEGVSGVWLGCGQGRTEAESFAPATADDGADAPKGTVNVVAAASATPVQSSTWARGRRYRFYTRTTGSRARRSR